MTKKEQLPLGEAGEISAKEEKLPVLRVKNTVEKVDPDVDLPFDLKEGESTNLGVFLTAFPERAEEIAEELPRMLRARPEHGRSLLLGRVLIKDKEGRIYREADIKGAGWVREGEEGLEVGPPGFESEEGGKQWGILAKGGAQSDIKKNHELLEEGFRVPRAVAVIALHEIVDENGEVVSDQKRIEEITGAMRPGSFFSPTLEIRLFRGTSARIADLPKNPEYLDDAIALVRQELGLSPEDEFTREDYLRWFAKTLGRQVGKLHASKRVHRFLTSYNITLDGYIVDFDSVVGLALNFPSDKDDPKKDFIRARGALNALVEHALPARDDVREDLAQQINAIYEEYYRAENPKTAEKIITHLRPHEEEMPEERKEKLRRLQEERKRRREA